MTREIRDLSAGVTNGTAVECVGAIVRNQNLGYFVPEWTVYKEDSVIRQAPKHSRHSVVHIEQRRIKGTTNWGHQIIADIALVRWAPPSIAPYADPPAVPFTHVIVSLEEGNTGDHFMYRHFECSFGKEAIEVKELSEYPL